MCGVADTHKDSLVGKKAASKGRRALRTVRLNELAVDLSFTFDPDDGSLKVPEVESLRLKAERERRWRFNEKPHKPSHWGTSPVYSW